MKKKGHVNQAVREAVELFYAELSYLAEKTNPSVLVCAVPQTLLELSEAPEMPAEEGEVIAEEEESEEGEGQSTEEDQTKLNFHDLLKARTMDLKIPIQLIIPSTYDETKRPPRKLDPKELKRLQDEATRAWNLHTALYYKAKGIPWRLPRNPNDFATCYVGVAFYETLDRSRLLTSVAEIFNERGEGVVVRGGQARISKVDRQPHLERGDAYGLLDSALIRYRQEHKNFPARIVLHKSSTYTNDELDGFLGAAQNQKVELVDLLSLSHTNT